MAIKRRFRDPIAAQRRHARAARRVGIGQHCACGETRPEALTRQGDRTICAVCLRVERGQCTTDHHHLAGRANDPLIVVVDANDHQAELTPAQEDWPRATRENPDGDPLLAAAARIYGVVDTVIHVFERMLLWTAELLEALSTLLKIKFGAKWWIGTPFETWAPKPR